MYKQLVATAVIVSSLVTATPVFADDNGRGGGIRGWIQEFRDRREEKRNDDEKKERGQGQEVRGTLKEKVARRLESWRQARMLNWWSRATNRLEKLIKREDRVAEKISNRLDRLAGAGRDVTQLRADLNIAKTKITDARTALASASSQVEDILKNNEPKVAFDKLHQLHKNVIGKIRIAHAALVKVLAETRGFSVTPIPTASSTVLPLATPTPTPTPTATPTPTPTATATP